MLEHQTTPLTTQKPMFSPWQTPVVPPLDPAQRLIQDHIYRATASLIGQVSEETLQKAREDMRIGIEQDIAAHQELGASYAEAASSVIQQRERTRTPVMQTTAMTARVQLAQGTAADRWQAQCVALSAFGGTAAVTFLGLMVKSRSVGPATEQVIFMGMPLLAGAITGIRARSHPVQSALAAAAILAVPTFFALNFWGNHNELPWLGRDLALYSLLGNLFIGTATAAVTGWLKRMRDAAHGLR